MGAVTSPGVLGRNSGGQYGTKPDSAFLGARATASVPSFQGADTLTAEQREILLDVCQLSLDIVGFFEPTPFADTSNAAISIVRTDYFGAAISLVGTIAYVGDAAKATRFPRHLKVLERAINEARRSDRFAALVRPILERIQRVAAATLAVPVPQRLKSFASAVIEKLSVVVPAHRNVRLPAEQVMIKKILSTRDGRDALADASAPVERALRRNLKGKFVIRAEGRDDLWPGVTHRTRNCFVSTLLFHVTGRMDTPSPVAQNPR